MSAPSRCWCGNEGLEDFSPDYRKCTACETLVSRKPPRAHIHPSTAEEKDLYGSGYWFAHQTQDLHQPDIIARARLDLAERCLHWLQATLKYRLPPGQALELGCAHGAFVALLRGVGFQATGLEMDPWVVQFAEKTFQVPMLLGPIEKQELSPQSLDIIFLLDVLEHLSDPEVTIRHCLPLLTGSGIFILQTPCFPEKMAYQDLLDQKHRFLEMMLPEEHLYLFSRKSIAELFRRLGFAYLQFEPAIFAQYDMFLFAGQAPFAAHSEEEKNRALGASPQGRMIQALLDTYVKLQDLSGKYMESEADRAARLEVIQQSRKQIEALLDKIDHLTKNLEGAQSVLEALRRGKVFKILRKVGLWKGMEEQINPILSPAGQEKAIPLLQASNIAPLRREGSLQRIAVDLTPLLPGGENGGARLLSLELVRHLSRLSPQCEYILLTSDRTHEELSYLDDANVRRICVSHSRGQDLSPSLIRQRRWLKLRLREWLTTRLPSPILRQLKMTYRSLKTKRTVSGGPLKRIQPDLLFCPFTLPSFYDPNIPVVSIIYDLQYLYYPQFFEEDDRAARERNFREACRLADYLICISEFVRQTVLQNSNKSSAQVISIPIRLWGHLPKPKPEEIPSRLQKYALGENDFLLYPANFWPHKNHPMLFTAFGMYRSRHPESTTRLVCTGSPDKRMESLREASRRMGLEPWVLFPGYLNEAEFAVLLASCRALIFPSLFEGFGMPLLEAMAFGKPVLSSNLSSLPEIAGGAALLFDPKNPEEIVQAIEKIHSDPHRVRKLVELGSNHLGKWGNEKQMTESYWRVFQEAVGGVRHLSQDIHGVYPDGWSKDEVFVTYGSSPEPRLLEIQLEVPKFLPRRHLSITVADGQTSPQKYTVARGKIEILRHPLPMQGGVVELTFDRFQPKAYGINNDDRWLGSLFHNCSIVTGDRKEVLWAR